MDLTPVPGRPNLLLGAYDLATLGYRAEEFFVSGSASSYAPVADFGPDGQWSAEPSGTGRRRKTWMEKMGATAISWRTTPWA